MSQKTKPADTSLLRVYPAPWKGHLLLACRKCQKKLKHASHVPEIANLRKALKHHAGNKEIRLRVLQVPCLKLCPKDAVTVCTQNQLAANVCSVVRTSADIDALQALCAAEATRALPSRALPPDRSQSAFHGIFHSR